MASFPSPYLAIYTNSSIVKGHDTFNHPLMININDLQSISLTKAFISIILPHYAFVTSVLIWNKRRNPMQLTQRKGKDTTVKSEEKAESTFAPTPRKPTRLIPLDKIKFPVPKVESALGPFLGKWSRVFLLTRFSNFLFVLSVEPILDLIF